jgi:hypothetical protein
MMLLLRGRGCKLLHRMSELCIFENLLCILGEIVLPNLVLVNQTYSDKRNLLPPYVQKFTIQFECSVQLPACTSAEWSNTFLDYAPFLDIERYNSDPGEWHATPLPFFCDRDLEIL